MCQEADVMSWLARLAAGCLALEPQLGGQQACLPCTIRALAEIKAGMLLDPKIGAAWHPTSTSPCPQHISMPCQRLFLCCSALTSQLGLHEETKLHLILVAARRGRFRCLKCCCSPCAWHQFSSACCWSLVLESISYHTVHGV